MLQRGGHEGCAIYREFDADNKAFATNLTNEVEFFGKTFETLAKFLAAGGDIREKFRIFDGL